MKSKLKQYQRKPDRFSRKPLGQMSENKIWNKCLNKTNGKVKEFPSLINHNG